MDILGFNKLQVRTQVPQRTLCFHELRKDARLVHVNSN